ncbi:MAG: hypothetical protein DRJ01_05130 [Bacteroidetes bacterium]|nr:MAG: hypothetical protein DRJ01_05130 [Bacteroidota bacterium]
MKEILIKNLKRYRYNFSENKHQIIVKLGLSQIVKINFNEDDTISITDKLTGWNFLTGIIDMSIKNSMIYQTIGLIIGALLLIFVDGKERILFSPLLTILIAITGLIIIWSVFYLIRAENMKTKIIFWLNNKDN